MLNREKKKKKAIEFMKKLGIYRPYINAFIDHDRITMYEHYAGFYVDPEFGMDEETYCLLKDNMKMLEETYNCLPYAITHEFFEFGECYSILIVCEEDISDGAYLATDIDADYDGNRICYSYTVNRSVPEYSEFGSIGVSSYGGGIRRKV